jgi:hypothetical protein
MPSTPVANLYVEDVTPMETTVHDAAPSIDSLNWHIATCGWVFLALCAE